uniref:Uncharacterized protein n=1 Tax=viral metagenome TaxID=1070528 RepID=A0A6M3KFG2_9ZZZZ
MCDEKAAYRYTWPGRDESFICEKHVYNLQAIARAMGFPLQVIPLDEGEEKVCQQKTK